MNEQIPISVGIKKAAEANELAEKFVLKSRVLKETPSIGGFKISQENLKKREKDNDGFRSDNDYNYSNEGYGKNTFQKNQIQNQNFNEGGSYNYSYNNINSTNFKTNSEGKFYNSNSTSKKHFKKNLKTLKKLIKKIKLN
jgi:hypothetical protein